MKQKTGLDAVSTDMEKRSLSEASQQVRSDTLLDPEDFESKKESNKKQLLLSLSGGSESNSDDRAA